VHFGWFLFYNYITTHGAKNIKFSNYSELIILMDFFHRMDWNNTLKL